MKNQISTLSGMSSLWWDYHLVWIQDFVEGGSTWAPKAQGQMADQIRELQTHQKIFGVSNEKENGYPTFAVIYSLQF